MYSFSFPHRAVRVGQRRHITKESGNTPGDLACSRNIKPDYDFFSGTADQYALGDTLAIPVIVASGLLYMFRPLGLPPGVGLRQPPMTPRERWQAVLSGKPPDVIPCDYWGTPELTARLKRDLGCATDRELWSCLGVDKAIYVSPSHPRAAEDTWHVQSMFSLWHVGVRRVEYGDGLGVYYEIASSPLAAAQNEVDIERFGWPDPCEWDIESLNRKIAEWPDHAVIAGSYEPFYLYCHLRGMQLALEDMLERPVFAEAMLERIHVLHEALVHRMLSAAGGKVDLFYVAEDLGTQESLLLSPRLFRRFLKPRMARMIDVVHSYGVKVFHHDDGAIRPLIPELIEIGIDVLNPIQWRCRGMERDAIARDFGRELVFHGGVDNQQTLPFGSPEDVRQEVAANIRTFRGCKGQIVAPCHNMQANTPTANVVAMYEAVRAFG